MPNDGGQLTNEEIAEQFEGYGKDDFLTNEAPYSILVAVLNAVQDDFTKERITNVVREMAKKAGCPKAVFNSMLKAATPKKSEIPDGMEECAGFTGIENMLNGQKPSYGFYSCSDGGIWMYDMMNGRTVMVCSHPVFPTRRYENIETGSEMLDVSFKRDGVWKTKTQIERKIVAQARQIVNLSEFGISVTSENAKEMVNYMSAIDDLNREIIPRTETISRLGWVEGRGFSPYIEGVNYDNVGKFADTYKAVHAQGDFQKWLDVVKEIRETDDFKPARIILAASVASVILRWTCNQPFMVHLWSPTSGTGKSIAVMLAASVWADPAMGRFVKSMNSTMVANEQMAAFCNNMPLCMDELQTIEKNKDFDDIIYMLCEGTGKTRSSKNLGIREQSTWLNVTITNGEMPINRDSRGGAINRVVSVEATGNVVPEKRMRDIAETVRENFGFAGKMIVDAIFGSEDWKRKIKGTYDNIVNELAKTATGKQANYGAAILTGDWLFDALIMKDGRRLSVEDICKHLATPDMVDMNLRAKDWLTDFVASNTANFRRDGDSEDVEFTRAIFGKIAGDGSVYILPSILKAEMQKNRFDYLAFLKWSHEKGFLHTCHSDNQRHWGIATAIPGVASQVRALHFMTKTFKPIDPQSGLEILEEAELPW